MSSKRIEIIKAELERIRKRHSGRLTPEAVVQAAKSKTSVLRREFDWDDRRMAHRGRLDVARDLIATYVTVTVIHRAMKITAPMYVRDPSALSSDQGYVAITGEGLERRHATQIILTELDRCESAITRARNIAGVLDSKFAGLSDEFESMLENVVRVRTMLKAA